MVCIGREKGGHPKFFYFNREWELMMFNPDATNNPNIDVPKPKCLEKMIFYAEKLSKPFPFVRVDFFCVEDKVIFGELTFTPSGGLDTDNYPDADLLMGNQLDVNKDDLHESSSVE